MANSFEFELNEDGLFELMRSAEMQDCITEIAENAIARSGEIGEGVITKTHVGKNRAYANIFAGTKEAARKNIEENTLLKVLYSTGIDNIKSK